MNKKKFKKLSLTAETLRNLSGPDLQQAAGGNTTVAGTDCTRPCTACTVDCSVCICA
jgi:hypothetical protein